jgi:hypothetical protein
MPHVQTPAGVGKHGEAVVFFPWQIFIANKAGAFIPGRLGVFFNGLWVVNWIHERVFLLRKSVWNTSAQG